MNLNHPAGISNQVWAVGGVGLGLINAFVLGNAWLAHPSWNLYMLAIPLTQCVLVAAWAGKSKATLGLRFIVLLATMLVSWRVVLHLLAYSFESTSGILWMLTLAWVVGLVVAGTRAYRIGEESETLGELGRNYVRIDLKTMMMFTLAAGLAFAFVQYGRVHWRWSLDELTSSDIVMFNLAGALTGIESLTCLRFLDATGFRQRILWVTLHSIVLIGCSVLFSYCVTPDFLSESIQETLTLWLSSNAILVGLVVSGRWLSRKSQAFADGY